MSDNKLKLIQDIELDNLNDENDFLETRKYSKTLQEIIKNTHTPCTIGLFGEWGSGKSSIIRDVIDKLDFNKNIRHYKCTGEKIRFVVYDAWKYSKDSFRRTFLLEVAKELKLNYVSENDRFYTNKTQDSKVSQKFNWKYLGMFLLFFIVAWVIFVCLEKIELLSLDYLNKVSVIAFLSFIATFSKNILSDYKTTIQEPLMFAPEQFENKFDNMHSIVSKKHNIDNEFFPPILHETNIDKLIIVVDNLDRCNADTVCEMLSDIKGFLNKDKVVFIVPLDDKMLKKHLEKTNGYDDSESSEYLRKIFDCVLSLKKTQEFDMYEVLTELLKNHSIEYNPITISIISEEYASNPRRIIKFINNFEVEKELLRKRGIDEEFIKTNETLIAFLLILKEEEYNLYQKILENISNIHTIGDDGRKENENYKNQSEDIKTESIENIYMKKFLEHTKIIWSKADLNVVDKVVCNLNTEDKLPYEIRKKLKENEFSNIKDKNERNEILKHLVFNFNKWCERKAYKTNALSFFKQIIKVKASWESNEEKYFDDIYNKSKDAIQELLEYLEDEEDIKNAILFIKSSKNKEYIANYKKSLSGYYSFVYKETNENGFSVKNVFKIDNEDKNKYCEISEIYKLGFEFFINDQENIQEDLKQYFYTHSYFNDYKPYLNLDNDKFKLLFNKNIIKMLTKNFVEDSAAKQQLIKKLIGNKIINDNILSEYLKKIFDSESMSNSEKISRFMNLISKPNIIELYKYIDNILNCIDECKDIKLKEVLEFFIKNFKYDDNFSKIAIKIIDMEENKKEKINFIHKFYLNLENITEQYFFQLERTLLENIDIFSAIDTLCLLYSGEYEKDDFFDLDMRIKMFCEKIIEIQDVNYQKLLLELHKEMRNDDVIEYVNEYLKEQANNEQFLETLLPKFKETFLKEEQDA